MANRSARVVSVVAAAALGLGAVAATATTASAAAKLPAGCKSLTLAFFGAQTGDAANLGINESNGAQLAVNQYNAKKPKVAVKLVKFDSQGDPAQAPALAQKAIKDPCIVGIVGPAFSGESKAAGPIFERAQIPFMTASATNPTLADNGWKFWHRGVGNDAMQAPKAALYITKTLKATKVAVIDDASEYGKGLADLVVKALGSKVVANESIDPKAQDFSSTVSKIKSSGATVVYYGGYYAEAGRLVKQMRDSNAKATLVSDDGVLDAGFVEAAGAANAAGTVVTCPCAPVKDVKGGAAFEKAYLAAFKQASGTYSVETYDVTNFYLAAIKNNNFTRVAINKYISTKAFPGLSKTLKFNAKGELANADIYGYVYQADGSTKGSIIK